MFRSPEYGRGIEPALFVALTIIVKIALGLLLLINRRLLEVALIIGVIFYLELIPIGIEFVYGGTSLALIVAILLMKEIKTNTR